MANLCSCGAKRNHAIHVIALGMPGAHKYADPSKAGVSPIGKGREEYQRSDAHQRAYAEAEATACLMKFAGAPTACSGPLTPHHIFPRSAAGSLERAEKYPVVTACAGHNAWAQENGRGWARRNTFERGGRVYPFLLTAADVRRIEAKEVAP